MSDPDETTPSPTPPPADDKGGDYKPVHGADDKDKDKDDKDDDDKGGRKRWLLLLLLLLLILLLLLCGGFAYMKWWQKKDVDPAASPSAVATATIAPPAASPSAAASPTAAASPSAAASPTAAPSPSPTPGPALIAVPNVVGKKATDAEKILADAGFTNVKFLGDDGKELTLLVSWKVVKQSVKAGTKVAADTPITLTNTSVSNGKG
ncbi:PASTA domain-containing protein [Catellatospora citrea]|uniref:PASTA domain-containing protein n=1 Tax=Catellatospora citrea TaxID=53366 RepID=A0A8J3KH26_9ACTN|nr:PASTA domain-containing protein [Catellatospora citrea]RKE07592.1 PASTA domain-containing protein [Catellatospora citrea]GIF95749.1 hypothetical protein Cci01nite_08430 [Catellatospora citrea]